MVVFLYHAVTNNEKVQLQNTLCKMCTIYFPWDTETELCTRRNFLCWYKQYCNMHTCGAFRLWITMQHNKPSCEISDDNKTNTTPVGKYCNLQSSPDSTLFSHWQFKPNPSVLFFHIKRCLAHNRRYQVAIDILTHYMYCTVNGRFAMHMGNIAGLIYIQPILS